VGLTYPWISLVWFVHGFATGFLTTWLGLLLVNIRPNWRKLVFVGTCYAVMNTIIRSFNIHLGIQFGVLSLLLIILVMLTWNLRFVKSLIAVVLGTIVMMVGETLAMSVILHFTDITRQYDLTHPLQKLFMPTPQILLTLLIIYLCLKYRLYIFDFSNLDYSIPNEKRFKVIVALASTMLLLLLVQVTFTLFFGFSNRYIIPAISTQALIIFSTVAMISAFIIMTLIIQQLFILLGKESKYITQTAYVQTLDELYTATRAESHDRINHMQTLYGFVQLGNLEETKSYLEELIGEITVSRNYLATGYPALSALFYIKSGLATSRGIQLDITTQTRVENLAIPPHELNRILGNLINNAFDSVETLPRDDRKVFIRITKTDKKYMFCIGNCGNLTSEAQKMIFTPGYSTKRGEHRGLGLYIVRQLAEKYRGEVEVDSREGMVVFTVYIPEKTQRTDAGEQLGSSFGPHNSGEFTVNL